MSGFKIIEHPVWPPPSLEQIRAEMGRSGLGQEDAAIKLLGLRQRIMRNEEDDPFRYGWEPSIWKVCDAIVDWPWCYDESFLAELQRRFGWDWETFKIRMREHLGFKAPVRMLLILGGNRSGKSEYAAKRGQEMLTYKPQSNVYAFHMSEDRSINEQQKLFMKYMPKEYQAQVRSRKAYVAYKEATGFANGIFINPAGSRAKFGNYMQERDVALQGIEPDLALPDELVPPDWLDTLMIRVSTRGGLIIPTFTPVRGYSPTVKMFCDSAAVAKECVAYLLPRDGRGMDDAAALGMSGEELQALEYAMMHKGIPMCPQCRPEDCLQWLKDNETEKDFNAKAQRRKEDAAEKRVFEMMPRVLRPKDPLKAVVHFYGSDNPYGRPAQIVRALRSRNSAQVRETFYGRAEKTVSCKFPKFNRNVHVLPAEAVMKAVAVSTRYMFLDPASDRNFFMAWIAATPEAAYHYREWPGGFWIPRCGVPGPWAIPSGKGPPGREGYNDGAKGEAQSPFGFGLLRYKFEIARLERWEDWRRWARDTGATQDDVPEEDDLYDWTDARGTDEPIQARYIDCRAASDPRIYKDNPVTLQTELDEINLFFELAPGGDIVDGVGLINSALDYDHQKDGSFFNKPHFFVSDACDNTIYSLENWMNADKQKGACKDPVDCVRWYFMEGIGFVESGRSMVRGGGGYGRTESGGRRPDGGGKYKIPGPKKRGTRVSGF